MQKTDTNLLKGIAIIMVVVLHAMAQLPESWWYTPGAGLWTLLSFDRVARFSVPLFLFLSWYGLGRQASARLTLASYWQFVRQRIVKLLPLYLWWSLGLILLVALIPAWQPAFSRLPLILRLIFGQADYHLYFVPLLIGLYLIFPLVNQLPRRAVLVGALAALCLQAVWILSLPDVRLTTQLSMFSPDQAQYIWLISWLGYAWLGLAWARFTDKQRQLPHLGLLIGLICFIALFIRHNIITSYTEVLSGSNIQDVAEFTSAPVMIYVTLGILALMAAYQRGWWHANHWWGKWLAKIGAQSYIIYLAHTLILRLTLGLTKTPLNPTVWVGGLVGCGVLLGGPLVWPWLRRHLLVEIGARWQVLRRRR